jgi:hypothetical protein
LRKRTNWHQRGQVSTFVERGVERDLKGCLPLLKGDLVGFVVGPLF